VVIGGRGGQVLLKNAAGTLHVRIFRQSDRDSAGYIHSFFHPDWNDPTLYDLLINTGKLSLAAAAQLIIDSVQPPRKIQERMETGKEKLTELALVQKAEAKLVAILGSDLRHVLLQDYKAMAGWN
jgi:hypothetical protein